MTKKDYEFIASAIRDVRRTRLAKGSQAENAISGVVLRLTSVLGDNDPKFDWARFIEDCKIL